ncbi:hypothetical protein HK101_004863, partial [Irineochytrium annulatum]
MHALDDRDGFGGFVEPGTMREQAAVWRDADADDRAADDDDDDHRDSEDDDTQDGDDDRDNGEDADEEEDMMCRICLGGVEDTPELGK